MRSVSRFESNLLRILHCFLGHASIDQALPAIRGAASRPDCLSREAVDLVTDSLAKGTVMLLVRSGAWTQQRHLRGDQVREGSLWQRSRPDDLGFDFSPASLEFLIWMAQAGAVEKIPEWVPPAGELSSGDQFLVFLAAQTLQTTKLVDHWFKTDLFRSNPLIALSMPDRFAAVGTAPTADFDPCMRGVQAAVLESMQDHLTDAWTTIERNKCKIFDNQSMVRLGQVQEWVIDRLMTAATGQGRRDLCRFLLQALRRLLGPDSHRQQWTANLNTGRLRLAERTEIYESASAFLRCGLRLRNWHTQSLGVGYFDEGYAESQIWKSLWESTSADESMSRAERIIQELSF